MCCCRRRRDAGLLPPAVRKPTARRPENFAKKLREGELDDKEVEIESARGTGVHMGGFLAPAGNGRHDVAEIQGMFQNLGGRPQAAAQAQDPGTR